MSRFIYFLTLFLVFTMSTLAQTPSTTPTPGGTVINTPPGTLAQGATTVLTWTYSASPQQNAAAGTLRCINNSTGNTTTISNSVNLADQKFSWTVNVTPGTYYLALNDGTGDKFSGFFQVIAGTPAPAASATGQAPAPAPASTNSPASPPPPPSTAKSPSTQSTPSSGSSPAAKSTNAPSASANTAASFTGSSVSGYKLLFSLILVAAVMVHFA